MVGARTNHSKPVMEGQGNKRPKERQKDGRKERRKEKRRKEGWEKGERESSVLHIMPKTLILRVRRYGH